jgi:integrase
MHLTDRRIAALAIPERVTSVYDLKRDALGLKLSPSGRRVFFWFRAVEGKPKWVTIGTWPEITLEAARAEAERLNVALSEWKRSGYPAASNPFSRPAVESGALTLGALAELYIDQQIMKHSSRPERATKDVREALSRHLADWRQKELGEIRHVDVLKLHTKIGKERGQTAANRTADLLRTMFNFAVETELWNGANPARLRKKERFQENERSRCLAPEEFLQLNAALDAEPNEDLRDFVRLSLATAQRKKTVMRAQWDAIDLGAKTWTLARTQTKNRQPLTIELTPAACAVLRSRSAKRDPGCAWVFPGIEKSRPRFDFNGQAWKRLLQRAGLDYPKGHKLHFVGHDLRHTAISYMVMAGRSLEQAGATVGHLSSSSTKRYAHLLQQVQRETALAGERQMQKMIAEAKQKQLPG